MEDAWGMNQTRSAWCVTLCLSLLAGGGREALARTSKPRPTAARTGPGAKPWTALRWAHEQPGQYDSDVYRWLDASGQPRTAVLTRNEAKDPGGSYGGMLRQFRYQAGFQERVATGTGASGLWNGWGYVVSHYGNTVAYSANLPGTWRQVFTGRHHAVHEFSWTLSLNGTPVRATVHWLFVTGRDHPVYAVTFDTRAAGPGGLGTQADSRTPYGDIAWDGDGTQAWVDGVRWGDRFRFFSRDEPLTAQSRWDYSQPNDVPFAMLYSRSADAEMGSVQTLFWEQHTTGGTWFHDNWGRTSETRVNAGSFGGWRMPANWNWPYQLCQYELGDSAPTRSKRLAWGLMYGAVGSPSYWGYGYGAQFSGHPFQSYSVYMVLGTRSAGAVEAQVAQVRHQLSARLSASRGAVVNEGPGGVGRTDTVNYVMPGYDGTHGSHELKAEPGGHFTATLEAGGGDLQHPLFRVHATGGVPARLFLDGQPLEADVDYFASHDERADVLWLTVHRTWSGTHTLSTLSGG